MHRLDAFVRGVGGTVRLASQVTSSLLTKGGRSSITGIGAETSDHIRGEGPWVVAAHGRPRWANIICFTIDYAIPVPAPVSVPNVCEARRLIRVYSASARLVFSTMLCIFHSSPPTPYRPLPPRTPSRIVIEFVTANNVRSLLMLSSWMRTPLKHTDVNKHSI